MSTESQSLNAPSDALKAYAAYPFDTDENYQQGLASILSGGTYDTSSSQEVRDEMIRRTRVFYFNKITGSSITLEQVREFELATPADSANDDETRVLTFAELKELIESGNVDKIPNNKIIPDRLNDAPPSQSNAPLPKKPWEKAAATNSS
ncbi:hypothetical protein JR316_0013071 [Psilocybe cubensis]|uniref:Uncharacterized protein n=2 Tax=Psilocybe cubensis TaxID=181762 RepID=A0A8H7XUG2_PSICU|nr:hypothetical protein JR316_0013071 [Psilocybe cubensis]KAH9474608.1 hypothetical protein JR316_0013071 [Psilocybe cubensis]